MKVLIVDDKPTNLKLLRAQLEAEGHTIVQASDGIDALEQLEKQPVDVVISDILMPRMDGYRLCLEIRKSSTSHNLPIVLYTSTYDSPADEKLAVDVGADKYLRKPARVASLIAALTEVAGASRTPPQPEMFGNVEILSEYSERLINKLEERNISLDRANDTLREEHSKLTHLLEYSPAVIYSLKIEGEEVVPQTVSDNLTRMLGFAVEEATNLEWWTGQLHPEDREREVAGFRDTIKRGTFSGEYRLRHKNGEYVWVEDRRRCIRDADGMPAQIVGVWIDITARKQAELRYEYLAHHDVLTGLPNRVKFVNQLGEAIAIAGRDNTRIAVFVLGLDHFKHVNDCFGHHVGDSLLQAVALRIKSCLRPLDLLARKTGDKLVVAAPNAENNEVIQGRACSILAVLQEPFQIAGHQLSVRCSIGISQYPENGVSPESLLSAADVAMYEAKARGRSRYQFYTAELNDAAQRRFRLASDLYHALDRKEFVLHYQPQVSLASGDIIGFEALLRWKHPEFGMISPVEFIPLLEEYGLIVDAGEWVLKTASLQNKCWQEEGLNPVRMAVNVSAQQFCRADVAGLVKSVLRETELDPKWLELELTESLSLGNPESVISTMEEIKQLGVGLTLDDFGTGWSSLSYLRRFPLDRIKIDRSFMRDIGDRAAASAVVSSIVDLARTLGLSYIAEGVETAGQLDYLRNIRCPEFQGYLFSPAVPAAECRELLRAGKQLSSEGSIPG